MPTSKNVNRFHLPQLQPIDHLLVPSNGLKVQWFTQWTPYLDECLNALPETEEDYPNELYKLLVQNPGPAKKRIALLTRHGEPVSIIGLRQRGLSNWEPVTNWLLPGAPFPVKPDAMMPSLEALGLNIGVGWWRCESKPPESAMVRSMECESTYRFCLSEDIDAYWRKSNNFRTVKANRNHCKEYDFVVNDPRALEWTICNWEAKWRVEPSLMMIDRDDRLLAARYLQDRGRHFTLSLLDNGEVIAGLTILAHRGDVITTVTYHLPEYHQCGAGSRLFEMAFFWARDAGYRVIDLGGGHDYKEKWAPKGGEKWTFNICPPHLYYAKGAVDWLRKVRANHTKN